jgi:hypothetical protein
MPQLTYSLVKDAGFAGLLADSSPHDIDSLVAVEEIIPGNAVVKCKAATLDASCRLPIIDGVVALDDAGTFTAGTIAATVVYNVPNGASVSTTYTQAFGTDKATSMAALAAKIAANAGVDTCVYSDGSHTITLVSNADYNLSLFTIDVTGITGTMTITSYTYSSSDVIYGIASHNQKEQEADGTVSLLPGDMVNVMKKGKVFTYTEELVTSNDPVYCRVYPNGATKLRGQFLKTAAAETISSVHIYGKISCAYGFKFRKTTTAAGLTVIEINLPQ